MCNIKISIYIIILILVVFKVHQINAIDDRLIVRTENGFLKGLPAYDRRGNLYYGYRGIPYAKPPTGALRFKTAEEPSNWEGIKLAYNYPNNCPQGNQHPPEDEDCLYVNVFVSKITNSSKPVMFYIYGGGLVSGSSGSYQLKPDNLMTTDIILVTFNYRLGVLGFTYFDDPSLNWFGNEGLKDQVLALKWVQKNIAAFGGDPNRVTIVGNSAGGSCVHAHLLNKHEGLFHRAIIQSGEVLYSHKPFLSARNVAEVISKIHQKAPPKSDVEAMEILNNTNAQELYSVLTNFTNKGYHLMSPIVEALESPNPFFTKTPLNIMKNNEYNDVSVIIGYNSEESLSDCNKFDNFSFNINDIYNNHLFGFQNFTAIKESRDYLDELKRKMFRFYYSNKNYSTLYNYLHLIMDTEYFMETWDTIKFHLSKASSNNYIYRFSLETTINYQKRKRNLTWMNGANHADELGYLFQQENYPEIIINSPEDRGIDLMVTLWSNFIKTGNPNYPNNSFNLKWEPFNKKKFTYLNINQIPSIGVDHLPEQDRIDFWEGFRSANHKREEKILGSSAIKSVVLSVKLLIGTLILVL